MSFTRVTERIRQVFRHVSDRYRSEGAAGAAKYLVTMSLFPLRNAIRYAGEYSTDIREGITTRSSLKFPTHDGGESYPYQPIAARRFREMIRMLPIDPRMFTFVDLGCGKGAALFMAMRLGFKEAIGVEIVPELLKSAEENCASAARRSPNTAARIALVLEDAGNYELPADPTVLFLFNPFGEATFRRLLDQIERSLRERTTPLYVLYFNPTMEAMLDSAPILERVGRTPRGAAYRAMPNVSVEGSDSREPGFRAHPRVSLRGHVQAPNG